MTSSIKSSSSSYDIFRNLTNDAQISKSPSMDNLMSNDGNGGLGSGGVGSASRNRLTPNANQMKRKLVGQTGRPGGVKEKYVAEIFEIRLNPVVSKRGYLNFLEEKSIGWTKKYVVVRRPFALIYNNERDQIERGVVNLTTAQIVYNEDQIEMLKVKTLNLIIFKRIFN